MTVKDRFKERIIKRVERLDHDELEALEAQLDELTKPSPEEVERRLNAWRGIFGMLSDPEEYVLFEEASRRRLSLNVLQPFE